MSNDNIALIAKTYLPKAINSFEFLSSCTNSHDVTEMMFYNKRTKTILRFSDEEGDELLTMQKWTDIECDPDCISIKPRNDLSFSVCIDDYDNNCEDLIARIFAFNVRKKLEAGFIIEDDEDDYTNKVITFDSPSYAAMFQFYFSEYMD